MARVAVMVHTMAVFVTWKCSASVSTRKTTTKKSKASRVQPRKLAATACHASEREGGNGAPAVEFESVSLFSSDAGTNVAGEVYTAGRSNPPESARKGRSAHRPEVRKDFIFYRAK